MATSRLGQILQQEYKSKGILSGTTSALGKRAMEKMDIRNSLFGGSGLGSVIGRKIFGKGYSATGGATPTENTSDLSGSGTILTEINLNSQITAKNTLALPSMARDMHLVKQNIIKMVKLQGGTPTTKAGDWFNRQAARESAYESKLGGTKATRVATTVPGTAGESGSLLSGMFGGLSKALFPLIAISSLVATGLSGVGKVIKVLLMFIARSKLGKMLGLTAAAIGLNSLMNDDTEDTTGDSLLGNKKQTEFGTLDYIEGGLGVAAGASGISKGISAYGATKTAVMDARTISAGQLAKSTQTTKWGKFLQFLAKRDSMLFKKIGVKLAQAGALMAIPIGGWIMALINLGFALWTAWDIYQLWKEFNSIEDKESNKSTSPTQTKEYEYDTSKDLFGNPISGGNTTGSSSTTPVRADISSSIDPSIKKVLETIKIRESKGDYKAQNPNSTASGAYQYLDSTWQALTKKYGIGEEYKKAKDAPPEIQDIVAAKNVEEILKANNGDVSKVPLVWYTGNPKGKISAEGLKANNGLTPQSYQNQWMETYNKVKGGGGQNVGYEALAAGDIAGGAALSSYSQDVAAGHRSSGGNTYNVDNSTTNNGGGGKSQNNSLPQADVIDTEFSRLLTRMASVS